MSDFSLRALDPDKLVEVLQPLPLAEDWPSCKVRLRSLPGASGVYLALLTGEDVCLRAEVESEQDEEFSVTIENAGDGRFFLHSDGRTVLTLPPDTRYLPLSPLLPPGPGADLDLVIIVDGTARIYTGDPSAKGGGGLVPLLQKDEWKAHATQLTELVGKLAASYPSVRSAVIAFADQGLPGVTDGPLRPAYLLHPNSTEGQALGQFSSEQLFDSLVAIPASSGGDHVDALADAMDVCTRLRWREKARRLVIITGDSPGYSILCPAPRGGDVGVRVLDVDTLAAQLHGAGIEISTIFHSKPADSGLFEISFKRDLLEHADRQYRQLASLPELAFKASEFSSTAAQALLNPPPAVGRGPSVGIIQQGQPL